MEFYSVSQVVSFRFKLKLRNQKTIRCFGFCLPFSPTSSEPIKIDRFNSINLMDFYFKYSTAEFAVWYIWLNLIKFNCPSLQEL